jgi:8-amino-3,8-dideoxy-alpha-D-manno-octulosonate transaminase
MPGFEWIDEQEFKIVKKIFNEGGTLMAHGFDKTRKKYYVRDFEKFSSKYFSSKNCLAVSSGTAAIKIALKSFGVKSGDEVITQSFNFIATIEAILDCGAIPVIANIDNSLNMDPEEIPKLVNYKTKAIIPVHMLGVPCEMRKIMYYSKKYKVPILEDNCEAVGGKYKNKFLGTIGDIGVFSFDHGKIITAGEGGMILTNNKRHADYVREFHDHGHQNNKKYPRGRDTRKIYGFNYRMTELQGAIANVQLTKLKKMISSNFKRYNLIQKIIRPYFAIREIPERSKCINDTFILIQKNKKKREEIIKILHKMSFGTKNLPDAMEWHCSYFWDHALSKKQVNRSKKSYEILKNCIAIPILRNKSLEEYKDLSLKIIQYR